MIGSDSSMENTKRKILVTEALPLFEEERQILSKYASVELAHSISEESLAAEIASADVLMVVYAKITERIINSGKHLKGIVRYGIGTDNVDVEAATKKRIPVTNVPDYCIRTVADHTMALLLTLTRKIIIANQVTKNGDWSIWASPSNKLMGLDLEGKTLGLIGAGKIGMAVAERAKGFQMKVKAYDPYLSAEQANKLQIELVRLDTLLKESDVISIHSPLTPETKGMIGERELSQMKKTAYLINTSRGAVINEAALCKALKDGWIAGAGLDVYEKEPPDTQNALFKLENVVLTPHISYYTQEATRRLEMSAVKKAIQILNGEIPENLVNPGILQGQKT